MFEVALCDGGKKIDEKFDDVCERIEKLEGKKTDSRKQKADAEDGDPGDDGDDVEESILEARSKKSLEPDGKKKRRSDDGDVIKKPKEEPKEVYADGAAAADWRGRVDKVLAGVCLESPKPLVGESFNEYRRRVIRPIVKYSPRLKDLDICAIRDPATFDAIEGAVLNDAIVAGKSGGFLDGDDEYTLIERTSVDRTGRRSSEFFGGSDASRPLPPAQPRQDAAHGRACYAPHGESAIEASPVAAGHEAQRRKVTHLRHAARKYI
jgi:hypothetical protein